MTATVEERLLRVECALAEMLKGGYSVYFGDKEFSDRHREGGDSPKPQ